MIRIRIAAMLALAATAAVSARTPSFEAVSAGAAPAPSDRQRVVADYGKLPLIFERVADGAATRFVARGPNYAVAVSTQGAALALRGAGAGAPFRLDARFVGGNTADATIRGLDPLPTRLHHIRDGAGRDDIDAPTYARVAVSNLRPGIDVVFHGAGGQLEYDVVVAPGADDPSRFALRFDATVTISRDDAGDLLLATPGGSLMLRRPLAFQDIDGERKRVDSEYAIEGGRDVRIRVGAYDRKRPLVVDPVVSYATFLGGSSWEQGTAIAVDAAGNAYVTGSTASSDFPLVSALDRSFGKKGDVEAFVAKLNAAGTALVWSTYIGGPAGYDFPIGIAVDAAGAAYIAGNTTGADFPTSANAWQKGITGGGAFVAKLAPAGNALAYSTYVAGATASAIAIDTAGNAYVSGRATPAFIATAGALQPAPGNAAGTGFVLKLDASGGAPLFATFLGGSVADDATSIAVDAHGYAYVGGWTASADFPVLDAFQWSLHGGQDAFIAKLDPTGSRLAYSTLVGGALDETINAIAVDAQGHAFVAGETYSADFPVKDGFQMFKAGANVLNASTGSAFVAKLSPAGDSLVYSSFLGGEVCLTPCQIAFGSKSQYRGDAAYGIAVDAAGHAHVSGIARSYTFPLVDSTAPRRQDDSADSAFVSKVSISGASLLWSTFVRTARSEVDNHLVRFPPGAATGVAVDGAGAAYVTGDADDYGSFEPTPGAFQTASPSSSAIVVKVAPAPAMSIESSSADADAQTPLTLTAIVSGPVTSGTVTFMDSSSPIGNASLAANKATLAVTLPPGIHPLSAILRLPGSASDTPLLHQIVDAPLGCN